MEMRRKRLGKRYYYPWDPLQLCTVVDDGRRVRKNSVVLPFFRSYRRRLLWSPLLQKNAAVFGTEEECLALLRDMLKHLPKEAKDSLELAYYRWEDSLEEELLALDDKHSFFTYHPLACSLQELLQALLAHRRLLREATEALGHSEAPNKVVQVLLLQLTLSQCQELAQSQLLRSMLISLLRDSARERLYLMVFLPTSEGVNASLLSAFSQAYFLGEEGEKARGVTYASWAVGANNFAQKLVGFAWEEGVEELVPLHPLTYTLSEWGAAKKHAVEEEERLYREYLAALGDDDE